MKLLNYYNIPELKKNKKKHIFFIKTIQRKKTVNKIEHGCIALKAIEGCWLTPRQLEATRRVFSRKIKKYSGNVWLRKYLFLPITEKPLHFRMGKGKGVLKYWIAFLRSGEVLIEIKFLTTINKLHLLTLLRLFKIAKTKLPVLTKIIYYRSLF